MGGKRAALRRLAWLLAVAAVAALTVQGTGPALGQTAGGGSRPARVRPGLPAPGSAAAAAMRIRHHLGPPSAVRTVPGHHAAPIRPRAQPRASATRVPRQSWPAAGAAVAAVPAAGGRARTARAPETAGWHEAGHLPVWVAPATTNGAGALARVSRVSVTVAAHSAATAAGVSGAMFAVRRADGVSAAGRVQVRLSYARFARAFGGGFGARLALFAMPPCALTTPRVRACRAMTPIRTVNDWQTKTVTAVVTAGPPSGRGAVFAADSTTSGGTGDFKATSLAPSSQWQVGLQTGDFTWSYPLRVPPAIGGAAPSLALSYDSGVTDGETAQANSQPGQIGEGFSLTGTVGFIERRYVSCADLITGKVTGSPNNTDQTFATGDQCWDGDNAYLSFGGHATELVLDHTNQTWHLGSDDGSTVKFFPGAGNGTDSSSHWEVIAPNGTQYYYGLGELPGWQSGNTVTNSVWTMPVFGLGSGDPCHTASYATSYCPNMPWRWNLDLVVDPNGNATSYYYSPQTNYYATDSYVDGSGVAHYGTALPYTSGGTLTDIWYGMQDNSSSSPDSGGNVYAHKAFNIHFSYADRCSEYGTATTYNTDYSDPATKATCENNETTASGDWPDTPWDLSCTTASGCTGSGHDAPVFFDTQMLAAITTNVEQGFNTPEAVDTWTLGYFWLPADVNSDLALAAIIHTGDVGSPDITLPPVLLNWSQLNNRVPYGENYPAMERYRLTAITSETGATTDIGYNAALCSSTEPTDPSANDLPCFPQYWTAGDFGGSPTVLWFYKYTVKTVTVNDPTGGEPTMVTSYVYCNNFACDDPDHGAAWHFDTDVDLVPEKDKSYGQWRGYRYVHVITGASGDIRSETDYTFLRGMYGDPLPGGATDTTTVTPSDTSGTAQKATAVDDLNALNGFQLEKISYDGLNTAAQVNDEVDWPWVSTTATSVTEPWGAPLTAVLTGTAETDTYTPLSPRGNGGTAGTRQTQTLNKFDPTTGLLTETDDEGDVSVPAQAVCTSYTYPSPASAAGLLDYPSEVKVTAGYCSATGPPLISDTEYSYDGQANGVAPVSGNVTETDVYASGDSTASGDHWIKQSRDSYDSYGRPTSSDNSAGFTTTTSYSSSFGTGYATTSVAVTRPLTDSSTETTTTTVNPEWGTTATSTDPDNERTDYAYDALGRVISVWLPGQTAATPAKDGTPNYSYAYSITATAPPSVTTTKVVGGNLTPVTSVQIFDSLLRPRQTQTQAGQNPDQQQGTGPLMDVTDTFYDSRGNTVISNGPYPASAAPSGKLWLVNEPAVPNETQTTYDGAGRRTASDFYEKGTLEWGTTWSYTGDDEVTQTPPAGGTINSTFTDARGHVTEIDQYHSKTSATGPYDATTYAYTPAGQLATITDPGGNTWNYTYDLFGRQLTAADPDTGTTTNTYNDLGQLTSVTDGAGHTVSYTYDAANRKTGEFAAPVTGQSGSNQVAAWTYDTSAMTAGTKKAYGLLASATSYVNGTSGEAYTETINSYDPGDHPVSTTWSIPSNSTTGSLAGTYTLGATYNLDDGTISSLTYPATGPLPAETDYYIEDNLGNPYGEWGAVTVNGTQTDADYVQQTYYNADAQPTETDLGLSGAADWTRTLDSYDLSTSRLIQTQIQRESTNYANDTSTSYSYDDFGNITAIGDSVTGNDQCYTYDYLARLTAAWAQGTSACPASPPATSGLGGPAPYEQTLSYDNTGTANGSTAGTTGNISGTTLTTVTGSSATTTAVSYHYPGYGNPQPHTPTTQSTSVNGAAPVTTSLAWTATGSQPGYLADVSTGGTTTASYNWNGAGAAPGQLFSAKTSTGGTTTTTSYRYDANGNLLVVKDGSATTLYLPGETLTATGTTLGGTRYYAHGGQIVAARTSSTDVTWLLPDPQGTATTAVNATSQDITRRYYTPYGTELGTPPSQWPGNRGFIGGTADATTALTDLGAREYNPTLPGFISPDPVLVPYTPTDLNPYAYAFNNPATNSDPSGELPSITCGAGDCTDTENPNQIIYGTGCNASCQQSLPDTPVGNWADLGAGLISALHAFARPFIDNYGGQALDSFLSYGQAALFRAAKVNTNTLAYSGGQVGPNIVLALVGDPEADMGDVLGASGETALKDASVPAEDVGATCGGASFTASTKVLLATGAAIPIGQLKTGDRVIATNTRTGKAQAETVTAVLVHHDTDLYDLKIRYHSRTAVIGTTSNHMFWVPGAGRHVGRWVKAGALKNGTRLRTPSGSNIATVVGWSAPRQRVGWMWDLTVPGNDDHDFYVDTAGTAVLVHNCGPEDLNYNQIRERISAHTNVIHGFGTPIEATKFAKGITPADMFTNLVERIGPQNETGMIDPINGNHEHMIPWPFAGANGENFVRAWMTSNGELGGMWPVPGP